MTKKIGISFACIIILAAIVYIIFIYNGVPVTEEGKTQMNEQVEILTADKSYRVGIEVIEFEILNHSETDITTDENYNVEFFKNGSWIDIQLDFDVDDLLISIAPDKTRNFKFYLYPGQFDYQEGQYRIVKTIYVNEEPNTFTLDFELKA